MEVEPMCNKFWPFSSLLLFILTVTSQSASAQLEFDSKVDCSLYFVSASEWVEGPGFPYPLSEQKTIDMHLSDVETVVEIKDFTVTVRALIVGELGLYIFATAAGMPKPLVEIDRAGDITQNYEYPRISIFHPNTQDRLDINCRVTRP
jgi:hypothetical protein